MARLTTVLVLLALAVTAVLATEAPSASPTPARSFFLTPYAAAVPPSDGAANAGAPSTDIFDDGDAAPIGAPLSNYPPVEAETQDTGGAASVIGAGSVAAASFAAAASYFLF